MLTNFKTGVTNDIAAQATAAFEQAAFEARQAGPEESEPWDGAAARAFEATYRCSVDWPAWLEAWCRAEEAASENGPYRPEYYIEPLEGLCTCGDRNVDHRHEVCVHEHCDCERFKQARRRPRQPRRLPQRIRKPWDAPSRGIDPRLKNAF